MTYELDWNRPHEKDLHDNFTLVGILTGLPKEDLIEAQKEVWRLNRRSLSKGWGGQSFIQLFRFLGFNTNNRFIKFDPDTDKPCIMRTTSFQKGYWYGFIYHDGLVNNEMALEDWKKCYKKLKITSMLQIWI